MTRELTKTSPPGETLAKQLEARHWSQSDFAQILGRPPQFVSEIISGKKEITRESAAQIAAALDTPPEYWLNLQNMFLLWSQFRSEAKQKELEDVRVRARMNRLAPIALLRKQKLITGDTLAEQETELKALFQIASLEETPSFLVAARNCNRGAGPTPIQKAWLACARKKALWLNVANYDPAKLNALASDLSRILFAPEHFEDLPQRFADVGVVLVYVEALPGSKINGASFILDDRSSAPVIAITGRSKRLNDVIFTLLHESAHIVLGHVSPDKLIIDEESGHLDGQEQQTDQRAFDWQLPDGLPAPPAVIRRGWIERTAKQFGVHPSVILGRLQIEKYLDWRTVLAKDVPSVGSYLELWP